MALVMALIVLMTLAVIVVGVGRDVSTDLTISRNTKVVMSAFNWAEADLALSEEAISVSVETRGADTTSTSQVDYNLDYGATTYTCSLEVPSAGDSLYTTGGEVALAEGNSTMANAVITYLGSEPAQGGSIIMAAGYEGIGKGQGGGASVFLFFDITSSGISSFGQTNQTVGEIYRYVLGGQ